jgi:CBS domain-containing protein
MRVSEAMTREVRVCKPQHSIRDCAKAMADMDAGVLPVAENNMIVGMVTDRDIAVRAIAEGKGPDTPVRDVLSREVLFCFDDQDLEHVAKSMGLARVRRVPVLARDHPAPTPQRARLASYRSTADRIRRPHMRSLIR